MKKEFNMSERTFQFALGVRLFLKKLPPTITNQEDGRQLIKASGSVSANYIEANDALGYNDFTFRLKISRKEANESRYWLRLLRGSNDSRFHTKADALIQEVGEIKNILSQMIPNHLKNKRTR